MKFRLFWAGSVLILIDQLTKIYLPVVVTTHRLSLAMHLVVLGSCIACAVILYKPAFKTPLAVLFAGAVSNGIDVVMLASIRDVFLIKDFAFNIADACIIVGGCWLLGILFFGMRTREG